MIFRILPILKKEAANRMVIGISKTLKILLFQFRYRRRVMSGLDNLDYPEHPERQAHSSKSIYHLAGTPAILRPFAEIRHGVPATRQEDHFQDGVY